MKDGVEIGGSLELARWLMLDPVVGPVRESFVELLGRLLVLSEALEVVEFGRWVKINSCGDVYSFLGL